MLGIRYSETASRQIKSIARSNKQNAILILKKIEQFASSPDEFSDIKVLKGRQATFKRLRAGDYRVIFDTENRIMNIYQIKHRKEAYK